MTRSARTRTAERIDTLMERATESLESASYFPAEALAQQALALAHQHGDYARMARILLPLEEARRQKRLCAVDVGFAGILDEAPGDEWPDRAGCWLVQPPLVGADGRELRHRADERGVPILLLTREPVTQLGAWPIVVIGPVTVRAYVEPPDGEPDTAWFLATSEALGEAAIASLDPDRCASRRVDDLFDLLSSVRDHDELHQALADACREALEQEREGAASARKAG